MKSVIEYAIGKFMPYIEWQHQHLGRQDMVIAVLRWAKDNRADMSKELLASLTATLEAELATHRAGRPLHPVEEAA